MGDHEGTREQRTKHPPIRRTEYGYLLLGSTTFTAAVLLCAVDHLASVDFSRGVYSILIGSFVVGGCGWIVRSGDSHRRRDLAAGRAELRHEVTELRDLLAGLTKQVEQLRKAMPRQPPVARGVCTGPGHLYLAQTDVDGDTVPTPPRMERPAPVDPEALRVEVERFVVEELGTRDAVRSQGYAEGYVDGIARKGDDDPPS